MLHERLEHEHADEKLGTKSNPKNSTRETVLKKNVLNALVDEKHMGSKGRVR